MSGEMHDKRLGRINQNQQQNQHHKNQHQNIWSKSIDDYQHGDLSVLLFDPIDDKDSKPSIFGNTVEMPLFMDHIDPLSTVENEQHSGMDISLCLDSATAHSDVSADYRGHKQSPVSATVVEKKRLSQADSVDLKNQSSELTSGASSLRSMLPHGNDSANSESKENKGKQDGPEIAPTSRGLSVVSSQSALPQPSINTLSKPLSTPAIAKSFVFKDPTEDVTAEVAKLSTRANKVASADNRENIVTESHLPVPVQPLPTTTTITTTRKPGLSVRFVAETPSVPSLVVHSHTTPPANNIKINSDQQYHGQPQPQPSTNKSEFPRKVVADTISPIQSATTPRQPLQQLPILKTNHNPSMEQNNWANELPNKVDIITTQKSTPHSASAYHPQYPQNISSSVPSQNVSASAHVHLYSSSHHEHSKMTADATADACFIRHVNGRPYEQRDMIGKGGSSRVYRVRACGDTNTRKYDYALKSVKLNATDASVLEGYLEEIKLLKLLNNARCEYIVQLIDTEITDERLYIIMELGDKDFAMLLNERSGRPFNINTLRDYWEQMLQCVHAIHQAKIVHSDLKPANFLIVRGGLKLIDFGIAKAIPNDTTNISRDHQMGTLNYMSPEAINGRGPSGKYKLGRASDVWSLGCILYQMIYGKPPFAELSFVQKYNAIQSPDHHIEFLQVPKAALVIVTAQSCLQRDYTRRPTVERLLRDPFVDPEANVPDSLLQEWLQKASG